jgi:predicted CoA-binding protein
MSHEAKLLELLRQPGVVIAVVGATDHPGKYGGVIYRDLKRKRYAVLPVNPKRARVDGDPAYPSLSALPRRPDIVNIVTPPETSLDIVRECLSLGLNHIWLQPGAEDAQVLALLQESGLAYLAGACVMVQASF